MEVNDAPPILLFDSRNSRKKLILGALILPWWFFLFLTAGSWRTFWNMVLNTLESLDETHPPSSSSSSSSSSPQQLDYEKGGGGSGQESSPDGGTRQGTRRTRRPSRWPVVPRDCRPATDEIVATVRPLVRDFVVSRRDAEYGWLEGLRDVVDRVDRVVSVLAGESRT